MFKKILSCLLVAGVLLIGLAACSGSQTNEEAPVKDVPVKEILANIQEAYGEDYLPNAEIEPDFLEAEFGLTDDMYDEVVAEMPMIGVHNDRVVIVRAAEGRADDVEQALNATRDSKIADTAQYPMNIAKTNASRIERQGDYVAFLLVGAPDESSESEEQAATFAEEQIQKAVDAFHKSFA